ncbi:MFS transporter [Yinghuangia seranimata]|uniref:MFS transporter n=1 Tax=Yinghuangia seranimata TaxID=408067 RepID=UPI00248CBE46|nr:MFS transporter [Yinghuangia seranimata]MDI2130289.1 MFS transporter [Yinghuangia seranimata]
MPHAARFRPGWALALLGLASLVTAIDFTIVYVALPEIATDVGFSDHGLQWVVSGYAVVYGGLLLLGGRLADVAGRRRMFVVGMGLYGVGSLLGGLAAAPGALVAARAVQGAGGAVLFPATLSLVSTLFEEGPQRTRAMAVWAVAGAGGLSVGALLGGVLTSAFGWQAVFFVNVPLVAVAGAAAFVLLPADVSARDTGGFDLPGAVTGTAGLTLLVFVIAQGPEWGWGDARLLGAAVAAVALLAGFGAVESRTARPLLPLRMLRNRALTAASGVIMVFGLTVQAVPFFLTLYFQQEMGFSALRTGVAFLGPTLALTLGNMAGERLVARLGVRRTLLLGFGLAAVGTALLAAVMSGDVRYAELLPGTAAFGLGGGMVFTTMWIAAGAGVPAEEQGIASGLASTALQFGAGAGLALLVPLDGVRPALWLIAAGTLLGVAAALALPRDARSSGHAAAAASA